MQIVISDYDPAWPTRFQQIGADLRQHLGGAAVRIDHIGSTSIPGLAAKDIIDVQVTVADLDDAALQAAVDATELQWRTDIERDHQPPGRDLAPEDLAKRYAQGPGINCHIRQDGRFNQRYALLFRDYLRAAQPAADAYAEIKRQLARHFPRDMEAYYDIKDPVFDLIMDNAERWADANGWRPGPSDA